MHEVMETRLFPKNEGADQYEVTGLAARCDVVILSDYKDPVSHIINQHQKPPRTIFLSMRNAEAALLSFHNDVLPNLHEPFVVVSGSEDGTFPVQFDCRFQPRSPEARSAIRNCLNHPLLQHWYAENLSDTYQSNMSPIPLGMVFMSQKERDAFKVQPAPAFAERTKKVLCAHRVRQGAQWQPRRLVSQLAATSWEGCCTVLDEEVPEPEFISLIRSHAFTICVEGGGFDPSPKAWLTLLNGGMPIIRSGSLDDAYRLLPSIIVDDWDEHALSQKKLDEWFEEWSPKLSDPDYQRAVLERLELEFWWRIIQSATPVHEVEKIGQNTKTKPFGITLSSMWNRLVGDRSH